ncbi:MAG: type II toxin-antitoxin system Phd/YefM family antitoxin [Proteobacteria bacterium]|nr:type II toxin-antitoxin system Phd/YefM family antitoxin [Pseudomonadota bacterium]
MQTIQASEFKTKCLTLMDDVARSGRVLVVTKNGRPIVEIHPYSGQKLASPLGLNPSVQIKGDIVKPIDEFLW